ncbi:alpha/beta-hydrolase [Thozetella sp. PMI_491]|nr:alpha/beta-hydrolase [Thozetella sp. PMI_491]
MQGLELADLETLGPCPPDLVQSTVQLPLQDGFVSEVILIRPASNPATGSRKKKKCPLIIYIHGGSFTYCTPNFMTSPARAFASYYGAIVACPSYKLVPEHPFPAYAQSSWEVAAWLSNPENLNNGLLKDEAVEFAPELGFILAGCSAGGNIAVAIAGVAAAAKAGEKSLTAGLPDLPLPIDGLFITIPYLLEPDIVPTQYRSLYRSREDNPDGLIVNAPHLAKLRVRLNADLHSPWFSPVNLDLAKLREHYPNKVYIQCGETDMIRDDAVIYERTLRDGNVAETKIDILKDEGHVTWVNLPFPATHAQEVKEMNMDGMSWLLGREWDKSKPLPY